jgi:hypothetical protein
MVPSHIACNYLLLHALAQLQLRRSLTGQDARDRRNWAGSYVATRPKKPAAAVRVK